VYYRFDRQEPCTKIPLSAGCLTTRCDPRSSAHKAVRVLRTAATAGVLAGRSFDVVHVSDRGYETLAPLLPKGAHHHRLDNPVQARKTAPAEIGSDAKFAYIGRLTPEKGAVMAAQAARLAGVPILFIGEGLAEGDIRVANPDAILLGWRSSDDVATLLRREVKAVVAPSLWYETGPLTVYEAAAAGVAAIASRRCGAAERVDANRGRVVEPGAPQLAGAMREISDLSVARRLGRNAYEAYWSDPPDAASHAKRLIALYGAIIERERESANRDAARDRQDTETIGQEMGEADAPRPFDQ
jgi:glycosyltransferase involved in cell wall biosynthesis